MARIRTIKPRMFKSFTVCALPFEARWLFAGMFTYCDDYGRGVDDARLIKGELFALDDRTTVARIEKHLCEMSAGQDAPICRYTGDDGRPYLHFPKWREHQKISHPTDSELPPCPTHGGRDFREPLRNDSGIAPKAVGGLSAGRGNEEEGMRKSGAQPSSKRQVANARAALTAAQNAEPGEGWLGDVLGLEEAR